MTDAVGTAAPAGPEAPEAAVTPSPAAVEAAHKAAIAKQVQEGKRKFYDHLEDKVLDYFHNSPVNIEACVSTCVKIFSNVVHNPTEEKFRKVKAASNTLRGTVGLIKGGEDLLLLAGWVPKVVDMEKYWVFDAPVDSVRWGLLKEALHLCERAQQTVHEKAEKKRREKEDKLSKESAEKERIRLAIEEDKAERKLRTELTQATGAVTASPLPSEAATEARSAHKRPPGSGGGPAEEDDDE
ncbi:hypothetical protein CHLRE_01g023050v5 [Chlamydomonas reinhardtii]|uniref:PUB domain-containing protein n=1 Tax=Chlamydomonas reinhardtii TaxID=3055 RepID=A0A2K3E662_CHLRE|nr:uncharacterized protein CHLRE_01g023050v5 [Chlamydomonas reinhardtii]PNW88295.1 hypothetical protein CHLRE_01g023050v5 [Chlamydomonas reinhardtii]